VPPAPDGGCVCYALRTGFSSSQGKLVRMIEGSTESVRTDTRDTALLLLLLLVFAVAASGYVLKKGMEDGDKSKYQLLLHCVLIITSVIPPELPMQMALAVNSALITLMKMQIFCTEPFRVPVAGRVDVCLFDKTGTLTTDELVAVGVTDLRQGRAGGGTGGSEAASLGLTGMPDAPQLATVVLGACHALVLVDGKVAGDPIEAAALKAIKWKVLERQKGGSAQVTLCRPQPPQLALRGPSAFEVSGFGSAAQLEILARHHFSSKLQRMSVVAQGGSAGKALVLAKGSPEAVATLIKPSALPSKYHEAAGALAKEGMRVLALAYKAVSGEAAVAAVVDSRAEAEAGLEFAGFVAFTCRVRKDTAAVIGQLVAGKHEVAMVTGDALLTAVHVAKQVGICRPYKRGIYILGVQGKGRDGDRQRVVWESYETGQEVAAFDAGAMPRVARDFDLCTTGASLAVASRLHPAIRKHLEHFVVFARMTPDEKEGVITSLKDCGRVTLMCGDGANDVGALKQAHVGVALLSGFGDVNVDRGPAKDGGTLDAGLEPGAGTAIMTRQQLEELERLKPSEIKRKLRALGVAPEDHPQCVEKADLIRLYQAALQRRAAKAHDAKNARDLATSSRGKPRAAGKMKTRAEVEQERRELMLKQQEELRREMEERQARGESFAMIKALMAVWQKQAAEAKQKRAQMVKDSTLEASAAKMASMLDDVEDGEVPMVKIGDASVAAPFTSKMPSIRGTVDIIRQGRCTLVTTIQMYQILALTCLISSYSLSVLHLDGVKYGDYQMTALGILMSVSFVTVSRSKPLERLSSVRPFGSVFHPALFLSILGQFALHLASMMLAVRESKRHLPADYKPDPDGEFKANVINSVVFLVSAVQQVSVFVVNLKGPPFMSGLTENSPLLYSLACTFVLTFLLASETIPQLNKFLQLVPFPTPQFRSFVLTLLAADIGCSFLWDRLMTFLFAPRVLRASMEVGE
jgi:manganese-transporting P-type ATPase